MVNMAYLTRQMSNSDKPIPKTYKTIKICFTRIKFLKKYGKSWQAYGTEALNRKTDVRFMLSGAENL